METHLDPTPAATSANDAFVRARQQIVDELLDDGRGVVAAHALTLATDDWVRALWAAAGGFDAHLIALGGFGRRELCHGSDVDLVIEVREGDEARAELRECVERFMTWARLTRVRLSHAVRTPSQTAEAFQVDVRTPVSYLDARSLTAEAQDSRDAAVKLLRADDEGVGFVAMLLEGYRARLQRYGQTIYLLEPDVKSGKGALRDVHMLRWAMLVRDESLEDLPRLAADHDWLLELRSLLHALHGRKHDRLHFPDQERIAVLLEDGSHTPRDAAEALMRRHYQVTRRIARTTERALRRWGPVVDAVEHHVSERFRLSGGTLFVDGEARLRPDEVLEGLRLASQFDTLLDPVAEERFEAAAAEWGPDQRADASLCGTFRELLTDPASTARTSTRLLELGVLTRLVPEFEPVVCHVQHDVYHVYTTDVHLLRCLEFGRQLLRADSEVGTRWPEFATVAARIEDVEVFLLSTLFHDIGKNRGGGHSEKGAVMMIDVAPRLGLDVDRRDLLSFLVREHLTLSHVARRHDLSDRRLLRDLAARIRTVEALNQLTALTFCDMSTVGRNAITDWNATLLLQLHERLEATIRDGVAATWQHIAREVIEVRAWLSAQVGEGRPQVDAFVRDLPATYLVEAKPEALARAFEAWRRGQDGEIVVLATPDAERGSTEVIVSAPDQPGVLAQITGTISSLGLNILDARIITTSSGRLLDIFQVAQSGGAAHALDRAEQVAVTDEARLARLRERLIEVLHGERTAAELLEQRAAQSKLAPRTTPDVDTSVEVIDDVSDDYTVVQVKAPDRIGLLYDIARTLSQCEVDIRLSKIDAVGTQVVDTFYLESIDHQQLNAEQIADVVAALRVAVEADDDSGAD